MHNLLNNTHEEYLLKFLERITYDLKIFKVVYNSWDIKKTKFIHALFTLENNSVLTVYIFETDNTLYIETLTHNKTSIQKNLSTIVKSTSVYKKDMVMLINALNKRLKILSTIVNLSKEEKRK